MARVAHAMCVEISDAYYSSRAYAGVTGCAGTVTCQATLVALAQSPVSALGAAEGTRNDAYLCFPRALLELKVGTTARALAGVRWHEKGHEQ